MAGKARIAMAGLMALLFFFSHVSPASATVSHFVFGLGTNHVYDVCQNGQPIEGGVSPDSSGVLCFDTNEDAEVIIAPTGQACPDATDNLVLNPEFESPLCLDHWLLEDHLATGSLECIVGPSSSHAAKITSGQAGIYYQTQLVQNGVHLIEGERYRFRFLGCAFGSPDSIVVGIIDPVTGHSMGLWFLPTLTSVWQPFEREFTASATIANAKLSFYVGWWHEAFGIDSVSLEQLLPTECPTENGGLLRNPSFECPTCLGNWDLEDHFHSATLTCVPNEGGGHAAQLTVAQAGEYYDTQIHQSTVSIVNGQSYHFRALWKASLPGRQAVIGLIDPRTLQSVGLWIVSYVPTSWQPIEADFVATETIPDAQMNFYFGWSTGTYTIDAVDVEVDQAFGTTAVESPLDCQTGVPRCIARPNPATSSTLITFCLSASGWVTADLYDASGRIVRHLADGNTPASVVQFRWDGANDDHHQVHSGVYFARVVTHLGAAQTKLVLVR
ncbi:MAG: FlgD immunoglobulin-like domain containing protein [bacterium]